MLYYAHSNKTFSNCQASSQKELRLLLEKPCTNNGRTDRLDPPPLSAIIRFLRTPPLPPLLFKQIISLQVFYAYFTWSILEYIIQFILFCYLKHCIGFKVDAIFDLSEFIEIKTSNSYDILPNACTQQRIITDSLKYFWQNFLRKWSTASILIYWCGNLMETHSGESPETQGKLHFHKISTPENQVKSR